MIRVIVKLNLILVSLFLFSLLGYRMLGGSTSVDALPAAISSRERCEPIVHTAFREEMRHTATSEPASELVALARKDAFLEPRLRKRSPVERLSLTALLSRRTPWRRPTRNAALVLTSAQTSPWSPAGAGGLKRLDAEGQLRGQIGVVDLEQSRLVGAGSVHLYFLRDQSQIKATVDRSGQFQAELMSAGKYAMIAAGQRGILAFSVEVR